MTNIMTVIVFAIVTNVTQERMATGLRALPCPEGIMGCCVYHCETVYSPTDYWEIEKVVQEERMVYTRPDGLPGCTVLSSKELSRRKRAVRQVVRRNMETGSWDRVDIGAVPITIGDKPIWMSINSGSSLSITNITTSTLGTLTQP